MKKSKAKSMTVAEAGDFFDEHDIFEFGGVKEADDIKFRLKRKKYIAVDMALFRKIKNKAKQMHVSEDALIQDWLKQKVG